MIFRSKMLFGAIGAALVVGVTALAVTLTTGDHRRSASSLIPKGDSLQTHPQVGGASHSLGGGDLTLGTEVLTLRSGADPVTVTKVELVDPKGMTLVARRIAGPNRPVYQFLSEPRLPPTEYNPVSIPAVGAEVGRAHRGWELLLGIHIASSSVPATMKGVRVEYRINSNGRVEQQEFLTSFVACTQSSQLKHGRCPLPDISGP